jgi:predicted phage terminase large subunit-like protein
MARRQARAFDRAIQRQRAGQSPDSVARVERAKKDFGFFCSYYLREAFTVPFSPYQEILVEAVRDRQLTGKQVDLLSDFIQVDRRGPLRPAEHLEGILDLEPRDHGKSTRMSQAFPLWLVLTQEGVFPVIIGSSKEMAEGFLDSTKTEVENNERILEDFGDQKGRIWRSGKIVLANGNALAARGRFGSTRGIKDKYRRPTHILCDDLLKDDEVDSSKLRDKLYKWFKRVVMNLGQGALIVMVNTILHPDDLPSRLLKEVASEKLNGWVGLHFAALRPDGQPIWPQRWPLHLIEKKRADLGEEIFATEWLNDPLPEGDRKFRKDWIVYFSLREVNPWAMRRVLAIDPSTGSATGDFIGLVLAGREGAGSIDVLEAEGLKLSDLELAAKIIDVYTRWKPEIILFEDIAFQKVYKNVIVRVAAAAGVVLPIEGVGAQGNKVLRIGGMSSLVEAGMIRFRENQELLVDQLLTFPKGNDDLPDALEMCASHLLGYHQARGPVAAATVSVRKQINTVLQAFRRSHARA